MEILDIVLLVVSILIVITACVCFILITFWFIEAIVAIPKIHKELIEMRKHLIPEEDDR